MQIWQITFLKFREGLQLFSPFPDYATGDRFLIRIPDKGQSKSDVTNPDVTGLPAKRCNLLPNNSINMMPAAVEIECIPMQISANVSNR